MNLYNKIIHSNLFRRFIFWIGTVRKLDAFPWVTWSVHHPKVNHEDIDQILSKIQPGDVGVHRDIGFLSNCFIPGIFKHAWIHSTDGKIIEAVTEGVIEHSARYPLRTDNLVILRPKLSEKDRLLAVERARKVIGFKYDTAYDFDIEREFKHLSKHDQAFSCIELVAYAYYEWFDQLKFTWTEHLGKQVLYPGVVVNSEWDVVYSNVPSIKETI